MDKKLVLVMGGGLLVGAGVFAWYTFAGDAMVKRDAARKPIAQWEAAWTKARACLLGDDPKESDPADTIRMRAFTGGDDDDVRHCSLAELGRPEGQGSGIPEIEDAWGQIETAWHALAKAVPEPDAMAAQIVALDRALAQLHHGAGLEPPAAHAGAKPLPDLTLGAPIAGTRGATFAAVPIDHALVGTITSDAGDTTIVVRGAGDVVVRTPAAAQTVPVLGAPTWGVGFAMDEHGAGTLRAGDLAADGTIPTPVPVVASKHPMTPVAAVGHGPARTILFAEDEGDVVDLRATRSTDGGAHWTRPETIAGGWDDNPVVDPASGAIAFSGSTGGGDDPQPQWLLLDDRAAPRTVPAAGPPATHACFARTLWYGLAEVPTALARIDADPAAVAAPLTLDDEFELVACTRDAAAARVHQSLHRCAKDACDAGLTIPNHVGFADVFDGTGVVFAAQSDRLIGVWRSGVAPVFVHAPAGAKLAAVTVWNGKPALAFTTDQGLRVAPLP